ncbi:MAG: SDR family NAD(P)-dependent oxidoreductase [Hyphomicrobiaceae bacterium]
MSELDGQVGVVTGGETGIGLGIVEALTAAGMHVVIGGLLADEGALAVAKVSKTGGKVEFKPTDVRHLAEVNDLVDSTVARHGRLDVMVNNAAIFDGFASCLDTSDALWESVININLRGCFYGCRAALRHMVPKEKGKIINVASVGGLRGAADGTSYTASKFAIVGMTRQIACDYAEKGISANAICPGVIQTNIRANSMKILGPDAPPMRGVGADPDGFKRLVPERRRGQPGEIGNLAVYLASDKSSYIQGQAIAIDGGWTAT